MGAMSWIISGPGQSSGLISPGEQAIETGEVWDRRGYVESSPAEVAFSIERTTSGVLLLALAVLLLVEGVGTLIVGVLTLDISPSQSLIPWLASGAPWLFGIFCLVVAYPVWRAGTGLAMTAVSQLLVLAAAVTGLATSPHPALWVAAGAALLGLTLSLAARSRSAG